MDFSKLFVPHFPEGFSVRIPTESELVTDVAETLNS